VNIDTRARPQAFIVLHNQRIHHGRLVGRRGRTARVAVVGASGVVRVAHARFVFPDWSADR